MRLRKSALAAALATSAALAPLGSGQAAGGQLLRGHFVVGQHFTTVEDSTTISRINAVLSGAGQKQKLITNDIESDHFPITVTVNKVYADGSGLFAITFGPSTVIKNGKTARLSMKGYTVLEHITTDFHMLSRKTVGASAVPASLASSIPNTEPTRYPKNPVQVGGTWDQSESIPPFGAITVHYTLTGLGTQGGRATASTHAVIAQPGRLSSSGLVLQGMLTGSSSSQSLVDTGQEVTPSINTFLFKGKVSGVVSGFTVKGTFAISSRGTNAPA